VVSEKGRFLVFFVWHLRATAGQVRGIRGASSALIRLPSLFGSQASDVGLLRMPFAASRISRFVVLLPNQLHIVYTAMPSDGKESSAAAAAVRYIEVSEEESGQRIDNYLLARLKGVPKTHVYRILRSGEVRINSKRVEASQRVAAGDRIRVPPVRLPERAEEVPAPHFKLPILFEDEAFLAIDKPPGLAVHGGSGVAHGVIESLRAMRPQARFLELVHRLDRETSGVLLVAKRRASLTALHEMMRTREMDKRYLAGVEGRFRNETQRVRLALAKRTTAEGDKRVSVSESGKEAETVFRRVSRGEHSLLEAQLLTGRTHQIRVHLAHLKHPVLGDDKYGNFELNKALRKQGLKRMFLHARTLAFAHPVTGEAMRIESPLPRDLDEFRRQWMDA
jgi:23S rRNA pseudouridine955/2504/2580 synthase